LHLIPRYHEENKKAFEIGYCLFEENETCNGGKQ